MSSQSTALEPSQAAALCSPPTSRRGQIRPWLPLVLAAAASVLLYLSLQLPLWQMRMEAPQYRDEEALRVAVFASGFKGDLQELAVLNQYIGVHVPETLPQFGWLPTVVLGAAGASVVAGLLRGIVRRTALVLVIAGLSGAMGYAMLQARTQMYDIGHKRDQKTILAGVKDFTPPLLGSTRIAQFSVTSKLGTGAGLIGGSVLLLGAAAWISGRKTQRT